MSEPTGDKPFKTLKLTSLKSAKGRPVESAGAAPGEPVVAERVPVEVAPVSLPPETPVAPEVPEANAPALRMPPPAAKTGGSLNMMSLKIGGAKPPAADSPGAATTPAPTLSPGAASSGSALKPFKVLSSTPAGLGAAMPPRNIPRERDGIPDTDAVSAETLTPPPLVMAPVEKPRTALKPAPVAEKKVAVPAKPSKKPVLIAVGAVAIVAVAAGAFFALNGTGSSAHNDVPVKRVVDPNTPDTDPGTTPDVAGETPQVVKPVVPVVPDKGLVGAPKVRRAELDDWLQKSTISTVTSQRITMNESHYSFGDVVNSAGNLRWMGRDSQTRELIFIDEDGVVYTRPAGGQK